MQLQHGCKPARVLVDITRDLANGFVLAMIIMLLPIVGSEEYG